MAIYYKPSQSRGKRLIYKTADPDAPKEETKRIILFFVIALVGAMIFIAMNLFLSK